MIILLVVKKYIFSLDLLVDCQAFSKCFSERELCSLPCSARRIALWSGEERGRLSFSHLDRLSVHDLKNKNSMLSRKVKWAMAALYKTSSVTLVDWKRDTGRLINIQQHFSAKDHHPDLKALKRVLEHVWSFWTCHRRWKSRSYRLIEII